MHTQGLVPTILPAHIVAGVLALLCGYVALLATKGARLHRKIGLLFVSAIAVMLYWLWRVRVRHTFRGIGGIAAPDVTALESK